MARRASFALLIAAACGPTVSTTSSGGGSGGETTDIDVPDTSTGDSGEVADACVLGDPAACPDECYRGTALQVIDDACGTTTIEMCLPGGTKPGIPLTTYWALAPSGPVFAEYGATECAVAAKPDVWHECSGAPGEPEHCACFCQNGYCRGDEDRRALEACGLDSPCGQLIIDPQFGAVDHTVEQCILEGLGARTPGVYEIFVTPTTSIETTRFYVFGGDEVTRIALVSDDEPSCPKVSDWGRASRCTLASSEYFDACFEPGSESCVLDLEAWVSACNEQPPACG